MRSYSEGVSGSAGASSAGALVLSINPGSTSTKLGLFEGEKAVFKESLSHGAEELAQYSTCFEQLNFRKQAVLSFLASNGVSLASLAAVIGRGGVLKPLGAGTYRVNEKMIADLGRPREDHPSNLGGIIAYEIAKAVGVPAYIADPVSVDEFTEVARLSGLKEIERRSLGHALNVRATAFKYTHDHKRRLEEINLVVAHLGGGISIVPFRQGQMVDVNCANDMGPFSPERAAGLPVTPLIRLCFQSGKSEKEMVAWVTKKGGLISYLGTNDLREVKRRLAAGDEKAKLVFQAMCYQIAKEIGAMATVLHGDLEAIVLTGGLAFDEDLVADLNKRVGWIAPLAVYPGEEELEALNSAVLRLLSGEEAEKEYS
jgi:butyrate kinase